MVETIGIVLMGICIGAVVVSLYMLYRNNFTGNIRTKILDEINELNNIPHDKEGSIKIGKMINKFSTISYESQLWNLSLGEEEMYFKLKKDIGLDKY